MPQLDRNNLPKPFFVLAPMDDVTDTVFRQIVADCAAPDLFFTEFVNVDGLQSPGRPKLIYKLQFTDKETPLIAQVWGLKPENFAKTVTELRDGTISREANVGKGSGLSKMQGSQEKQTSRTGGTVSEASTQLTQRLAKSGGRVAGSASKQGATARMFGGFAGVDLNFGCPVKTVVKNGACSALIGNRGLAGDILTAVKEAAGEDFPVSVKTRLGQKEIDYSWIEFLLKQKLNMLTIHARTVKEMSKIPAHWDAFERIIEMRNSLSPTTLIVGNGDVMSRAQGEELAEKYGLDGIMIGRGVFHDPFVFAKNSPWANYTRQQKIDLYTKHVKLFVKTWPDADRKIRMLNKFCKVYVEGFPDAKELREKLMAANSAQELLTLLK